MHIIDPEESYVEVEDRNTDDPDLVRAQPNVCIYVLVLTKKLKKQRIKQKILKLGKSLQNKNNKENIFVPLLNGFVF